MKKIPWREGLHAYGKGFIALIFISIFFVMVATFANLVWATGKEFYAKLFPPPPYAEYFYNHLSPGDVTSTQCGQLQDAMRSKQTDETLSSPGFLGVINPELEDSIYLYKKHRCVGVTSIALDASIKNGHVDSIIDLATNAVLVSCTVDYTTGTTVAKCSDVFGNDWNLSNGEGYGQLPFPIYSGVFLMLGKWGGQ